MDSGMKWKAKNKNAIDALLALGRVFGLMSGVYLDATDYVMKPSSGDGFLLEYEDMPTYGQVFAHAKQYMNTHKEES